MNQKLSKDLLKRLVHQAFPYACSLALIVASGCGREEIRTYSVPKEQWKPAPTEAHDGHDHADAAQPRMPHLHWNLPQGWTEQAPSGMRAASFSIVSVADGATNSAQVAVIPLPGRVGLASDGFNMWRREVDLPEVSAEEVAKNAEPVSIGDSQAQLIDVVAKEPLSGRQSPNRIVGAILERGGTSWFFKMAGDDPIVVAQKGAFKKFLKTLTFDETDHSQEVADSGKPVSTNVKKVPDGESVPPVVVEGAPVWQAPETWVSKPASGMRMATFTAGGDNGADVSVLKLSGTGGGLKANIDRWRGQIGLGPLSEAELPKETKELDLSDGKAILVDMSGTDLKTSKPVRVLGAIITRSADTWFVKMTGEANLVAREKEAFVKFIQSFRFPNA